MSKYEKPRTIEKIAGTNQPCLAVCAGKHCAKAGTKHILRAVRAALDEAGLADAVRVELTKCQDYCDDAPILTVLPGLYPYVELTPMAAQRIVAEHLRAARPVTQLLHKRARKRLQRFER